MKRTTYDFHAEMRKAWDWCWAYYCKPTEYRREIYSDGGMPTGEFEPGVEMIPARQSWLTATDLERRLRAAAVEVLDGRPYGSAGPDGWGSRVRISHGGRGTLLDAVRDWLARQPGLERHNFGKGHISGMRYRPRGTGLTEGEKATVAAKQKRAAGLTPVHFGNGASNWFARRPLCVAPRKRTALYRAPKRSAASMTADPAAVTCPRCKKLLAAGAVTVTQTVEKED